MSILPLLLHLIVISFSKLALLNLHLSGLNVFSATLNSFSTGTDVAGIYRYLDTNFDNTGKRAEFTFQKSMGFDSIPLQNSAKFASSSVVAVIALFGLGRDGDIKLKKSGFVILQGGDKSFSIGPMFCVAVSTWVAFSLKTDRSSSTFSSLHHLTFNLGSRPAEVT